MLRGLGPGLDPSARVAQMRSGEPYAPTMCLGVLNMNPRREAPVRLEFPASGESLSGKAYIPPAAGIYSTQRNVTGSGEIVFSEATNKEPAKHST